jgi:hypothetical protein
MPKLWYFRVADLIGPLSLAVMLVTLVPFLDAVPMKGPGIGRTDPAVSVNHLRKGDRLPLLALDISSRTAGHDEFAPQSRPLPSPRLEAKVPVGCDPVFSSIGASSRGNIYRRCST